MGQPIDFPGSNVVLTASPGTEGFVQPMHVYTNGTVCVSCWELSIDDLKDIIKAHDEGQRPLIYVSIFSGKTQPPIYIGSSDQVRKVIADFGAVWKKE